MVHTPTRLLNTLDLFITNSPSIVKSVHVIRGYSDHETVVVDCALAPDYSRKKTWKFLKFLWADWDGIRKAVSDFSAEFFR